MQIALFKTLWGHDGGLDHAIHLSNESGFQGIEGPTPLEFTKRREFFETLAHSGLEWIAEVCSCTPAGYYLPMPHLSVEEHLLSLEEGVIRSLEGAPLFINAMVGYDAWSFTESVRFFEGVIGLQDKHDVVISVETHRGRPTFNPWTTRDLLEALPGLRITCDFSHWCVVSERFVLDEFQDILSLVASRCHHLHVRVGYGQGPQVPDPRAPEYADALAAHERWWWCVWESMRERHFSRCTMTPEFGPDGYLQCAPFTGAPVADLWEINRWIGLRQLQRFQKHPTNHPSP